MGKCERATEPLIKAVTRASQLSKKEQDMIAALVLMEIESEQRWNRLLKRSQDALARLAADAISEHRAAKTKRLDIDKLFPRN